MADKLISKPFRITSSDLVHIAFQLALRPMVLYVAVFWLIAAWLFVTTPFEGAGEVALMLSFASVLGCCIGICLSIWRNTRERVKRVLGRQNTITIEGDWLSCFGEDGSESRSNLNDYHRVRQVPGFFVLYATPKSYFPIPYAAFETEADAVDLRRKFREAGLLR